MKKRLLAGLAVGVMLLGAAGAASATAIDFESTALGGYSSLSFTDLTITYTNGDFDVVDASPGAPISGHALTSWWQSPGANPFLITFNDNTNVKDFSIGVGDYNEDEDNTYLQAFDADWNLIGSDYYLNPSWKYGGDNLSVITDTAIKYVKFWDSEPYAGAVLWDNISYASEENPVPEPATMFIMGAGLTGLVAVRRKKKS